MGRPAKAIAAHSANDRHDYSARIAAEKSLQNSPVTVPEGLTAAQENIVNHIISELKKADILCDLDIYVLEQCAVAADCLHKINEKINSDDEQMYNKDLLIAKEKHEKTFFKCCDLLCLAPQSRAKIAAATVQKDESADLLKAILSGEKTFDDEE